MAVTTVLREVPLPLSVAHAGTGTHRTQCVGEVRCGANDRRALAHNRVGLPAYLFSGIRN